MVGLLADMLGLEDGLAQADVLRRDLDELIAVDVLDGLLEGEDARRREGPARMRGSVTDRPGCAAA